jgi:hypothetical protein
MCSSIVLSKKKEKRFSTFLSFQRVKRKRERGHEIKRRRNVRGRDRNIEREEEEEKRNVMRKRERDS